MGLISFSSIVDGTGIDAADVNNPLNTIYNEFNGNISSANLAASAVGTTQLAAGSVTPAQLTSGTGASWAWQSWTPTWTNVTVGNATQTCTYIQIGKTVFYKLYLDWGSTTSIAGSAVFSLPVTSVAVLGSGMPMGMWRGAATSTWQGPVVQNTTTTATLRCYVTSGSNVKEGNLGATTPETWDSSSVWYAEGFYEAA